MKSEEYIDQKVGRRLPFNVPENYFENLPGRVELALPPFPEAPKAVRLSNWHRLRPYIYLAAMFAGIWCMMKVFHSMSAMSEALDAPAEHIAMVMENPAEYGIPEDTYEDFELESEIAESFSSPEELRKALNNL